MHGKRGLCALLCLMLLALSACTKGAPKAPETTASAPTAATPERQAEADMASPDAKEPETAQSAATETGTQASPAQNADIGPLFQKFVRERVDDGVYTMRTKQSGLSLVTTFDGDDSVLDSDAAGLLRLTLIRKGGEYYMLCGNTKNYVELTAEEYAKQAGDTLKNAKLRLDNMHLKETGEQTVGGKKYSTEVYDEGDLGTVTYYFDDSGLRRSTIDKNGTVSTVDPMEILDEADPAAFEIPAGYVKIADASQLFTN